MNENRIELSEVTKSFLDFEKENNLFSIEIKGHRFWDYIRYHIYERYINTYLKYKNPKKAIFKKYIKYIRETPRNFLYIVILFFRKKKKYDILFITQDRYNIVDGRNVDWCMYPIIKHLCSKYNILSIDPSILKIKIERNYPCDVLRFRPFHVINRIKSLFLFYNHWEKETFSKISLKFEDKFKFKMDIYAVVRNVYSFQLQNYKRYLRILKKYQPQVIIYADDGNKKGLIEAANKLKISTVALQRSIVSGLNITFTYPYNIEKYSIPSLSDYIFTFGNYWNKAFNLPAKQISVGFPYFDYRRKETSRKRNQKENMKSIIILSSLYSRDLFARIALELSDLLPDFTIYYKLRVEEYYKWQEQYPESFARKGNIKVIDNNDISLYEYFTMCKYQIGTNSTTLYEGLAFGLVTFILKTGWYEEMRYLYENDYVFLVSGAEEIAHKIINDEPPRKQLSMDEVFKSDSLQNVENAIRSIMNK